MWWLMLATFAGPEAISPRIAQNSALTCAKNSCVRCKGGISTIVEAGANGAQKAANVREKASEEPANEVAGSRREKRREKRRERRVHRLEGRLAQIRRE